MIEIYRDNPIIEHNEKIIQEYNEYLRKRINTSLLTIPVTSEYGKGYTDALKMVLELLK